MFSTTTTNTAKTFFTSNFYTFRNYEFQQPSVQKKKKKNHLNINSCSLAIVIGNIWVNISHTKISRISSYYSSAPSGHILGLHHVRLSNTAPFCENYAERYFDAKHLKNELNQWVGEALGPYFKKGLFLSSIEYCPKVLDYALFIEN